MKGTTRTGDAESVRERAGLGFSSVIGQKMFVLLRDLAAPVKAGETEFNVLIKALRYFYSPEKNVFSNRF